MNIFPWKVSGIIFYGLKRCLADRYLTRWWLRTGVRATFYHLELVSILNSSSNDELFICWTILRCEFDQRPLRQRQRVQHRCLISMGCDLFWPAYAQAAAAAANKAQRLMGHDKKERSFLLSIVHTFFSEKKVSKKTPASASWRSTSSCGSCGNTSSNRWRPDKKRRASFFLKKTPTAAGAAAAAVAAAVALTRSWPRGQLLVRLLSACHPRQASSARSLAAASCSSLRSLQIKTI